MSRCHRWPGRNIPPLPAARPLGVVVGIVPWNFSIMIAIWKLAAALVCGCTIVLKPSEYTPLTLLRRGGAGKSGGYPGWGD
ncbi:Aldehyde dehydrogenase [Klebsiella pneumoniae IS10]|nr:Aldehyde dehydrogenase [Klebsiella pneumoniae IS10]